MQQAVDIVEGSEHPANKVAATLAGRDHDGREFAVSMTNYWPDAIKRTIGTETRIGNSSGTIHAETAVIIKAPVTENSAMFVTDLPCPNCVKNMVEAGVKNLSIDHKGFDKDFALRRSEDFEAMSLRLCEKSGISVYKIFRREQRTEVLLKTKTGFTPAIEKPARITPLAANPPMEDFKNFIEKEKGFYRDRPFALAVASSLLGKYFTIAAEAHACPGTSSQTPENGGEKYSPILQPVNRLMMAAERYGLKIVPGFLYSSRVPTARELVDMVGAGLTVLAIGDTSQSRDEYGPEALRVLTEAGIVRKL